MGECEQYNLKHPVVSINKETPRRRISATSSLNVMKYPQISSEKGGSGSFTPPIPSRLLDRLFKIFTKVPNPQSCKGLSTQTFIGSKSLISYFFAMIIGKCIPRVRDSWSVCWLSVSPRPKPPFFDRSPPEPLVCLSSHHHCLTLTEYQSTANTTAGP